MSKLATSFVLGYHGCEKSVQKLPENINPKKNTSDDLLLRYLDCAVINHLHNLLDYHKEIDGYDTVRGLFIEGDRLYPNSGFFRKTHIQIAVRNMDCIKGFFFPPELNETP